MKWLSGGLTFVNIATFCGLLLGMVGNGLGPATALLALLTGLLAGAAAYLTTSDTEKIRNGQSPKEKSRYGSTWLWVMAAFFAIFACRSFLWLLYSDGAELRIQSTNNLGDLALHLTYIKEFANGAPLWPPNPIFPEGRIRYPAGVDLFNALLLLARVDLLQGLTWVGLAGAAATFYALWRWGKVFGIAGFLFNGGIVGFQILNQLFSEHDLTFIDYQGKGMIAWKSIPLAMFVTQRGWLFALPAGLLLLWHWREKFYRKQANWPGPLPLWVELSLYGFMPLFHVHTFLALSVVLACLFLFGNPGMRGHLLTLVAAAVIPATLCVWTVTDHFHAQSIIKWWPGWLMRKGSGELYHPFFYFWFLNFGAWMPLILFLYGERIWRFAQNHLRGVVQEMSKLRTLREWKAKLLNFPGLSEDTVFLVPAAIVFLLGIFWKFAPWEWDNMKIMIWGYFIVLPFLWRDLIATWSLPVRAAMCVALFGSGFVSLFGGLSAAGYTFAQRGEMYAVGVAVRDLPVTARFAGFPTYNHPVLLNGRPMLLGYGGHLWTQGFDYGRINDALKGALEGRGDWRETMRKLGAHYLFWGREENINYPSSTKPWEKTMTPIGKGDWGAIYDLGGPGTP